MGYLILLGTVLLIINIFQFDPRFKQIVNIVGGVLVLLWFLAFFGVMDGTWPSHGRFPC